MLDMETRDDAFSYLKLEIPALADYRLTPKKYKHHMLVCIPPTFHIAKHNNINLISIV